MREEYQQMTRDSKTTTKALWEELDRIAYFSSIGACVFFSIVYFLLWFWNPAKDSFSVAIREFFLALITNLVPIFLIFALSYALLRRIQFIRSEQESDALATDIANKTQAAVVSELQIVKQKMDEILEYAELGHTTHSLGVFGITSYWTDFVQFKGSLGMHIKKRLLAVEHPATWYIVTMGPEGLMSWLWDIKTAVENRGVNVKWVYHARKSVESNDALKAQWEWLMPRFPDWRDRASAEGLDYLETKIKELHHWTKESSLQIHAMDEGHQKRAGHWELYESKVPHFYMAFLSVPGKYEVSLKQAPDGTFGFVQLYPMFPHENHTRPALYLEAPGQILDYYYWSTVQLFDEGVKREYLWRTWPSETTTKY
jgi:hypothetical protein